MDWTAVSDIFHLWKERGGERERERGLLFPCFPLFCLPFLLGGFVESVSHGEQRERRQEGRRCGGGVGRRRTDVSGSGVSAGVAPSRSVKGDMSSKSSD